MNSSNFTVLPTMAGALVNTTVTQTLEGGFLSGRNPLTFNPTAPLTTFIVQLVLIVSMSRLVKFVFSPIRQPSVIAEIVSGIILGPTAFGHIPRYTELIFPKPSLPFLNLMSNFGLVIFLFLVGLELDPKMLKRSMKQSLFISLAGMILPFGCGASASYALYTYLEPPEKVTFIKYFLFLGVAMSITAFPVLARILTELNLLKTKVGSITIAAAAADDATSWCLLALVISLINAGSALVALYVFLIGLGYTLFILFAVRPVYIWILRRHGAFRNEPSQCVMCLTLMMVFISAFITDALGIHAIFGGFLVGIMVPHDRGLAYKITKKLEDIVAVVFLPLYFALSGLKTHIGSLDDAISWALVCLVIFVACAGKIIGCAAAARISRLSWRESVTIGVLMNCKGLVELIVLNLGYDVGLISQRTFAIMVIMALFTTFLTVPIVSVIYPQQYQVAGDTSEDNGEPEKSKALYQQSSLLVCVDDAEHVPAILKVIGLFESVSAGTLEVETVGKSKGTSLLCVPKSAKAQPEKRVIVSALRLIEITERNSSVMIQTSPDSLREDTVMKMMEAFGKVTCLDIQGLVCVVTANNFVHSIVDTANTVGAAFILIPWAGNASIQNDDSASGLSSRDSRTSRVTTTQHVDFIHGVLTSRNPASILILVDRGDQFTKEGAVAPPCPPLGIVTTYQQIFFMYFGGTDDRHALQIVLASAEGQQERVTNIIRFKRPHNTNLPNEGYSNPDVDNYSATSGPQDHVQKFPEAIIEGEGGKTDIADQFFERGPESWQNVTYLEIETTAPIPTLISCVKGLDGLCLVVVGRSHDFDGKNYTQMKNADPERRKTLGDVAEAILLSHSTAGVLVMQGPGVQENGRE